MPATKFKRFSAALDELCRKHDVVLATTGERLIGVFDAVAKVGSALNLDDRTGSIPALHLIANPPKFFGTAQAAQDFPGYLGHELSQTLANTLASAHPGSIVIPIGAHDARAWAVVGAFRPPSRSKV